MTSEVCIKASCSYRRLGRTEREYKAEARAPLDYPVHQRLCPGSQFCHPGDFLKETYSRLFQESMEGLVRVLRDQERFLLLGSTQIASELPSMNSTPGDHTFFWQWSGTVYSDGADICVAEVYAQTYIHIHKIHEFFFLKNKQRWGF